MIAVYIRVSTDEQNPEGQRVEIQKWLDARDYSTAQIRWFEDKESGKTTRRPAFQKLLEQIAAGKVETVICWKLDRLSRSLLDGVKLVAEWSRSGVRIISVTQNIDLDGLTGQIVATVLFAVAEMELAHLKERQKAGIAVAKSLGKYKGRKPGSLKGNPQRAHVLQERGLTQEEIASALNISARTVRRYLK